MDSVVVYRYFFEFIFLQNILLITLYRCLLHFIVNSKMNLKQMCLFLDRDFFLKYTQSMKRNKQNENLNSTAAEGSATEMCLERVRDGPKAFSSIRAQGLSLNPSLSAQTHLP